MSNHLETNTRIFILRIWLEEDANGKRQAKWRGYITNALDGTEKHIEGLDLDEIIRFILPYLENTKVKISWPWRFLIWCNELSKKKKRHQSTNKNESKNSKTEL